LTRGRWRFFQFKASVSQHDAGCWQKHPQCQFLPEKLESGSGLDEADVRSILMEKKPHSELPERRRTKRAVTINRLS
jgi:hypothetical protein